MSMLVQIQAVILLTMWPPIVSVSESDTKRTSLAEVEMVHDLSKQFNIALCSISKVLLFQLHITKQTILQFQHLERNDAAILTQNTII